RPHGADGFPGHLVADVAAAGRTRFPDRSPECHGSGAEHPSLRHSGRARSRSPRRRQRVAAAAGDVPRLRSRQGVSTRQTGSDHGGGLPRAGARDGFVSGHVASRPMTVIDTVFRFDADSLLAPISANEPTGESLRYEGTYDIVAGLRREDDPALEQGVWKTELKKADWPGVAQACVAALESRSKDLQLAAWLLESWIHLYGFAGIREGLHLVAELCDTYWDGLHPDVVDGDLDYRLAPIYWIDEKLSIAARLIPIVRPHTAGLHAHSPADLGLAAPPPPPPRARASTDAVTEARLQKSVTATSTTWLATVASDGQGALRSLDELIDVLKTRCGARAPGLARMREALTAALHIVSIALESRGAPMPTFA